MVIAVVALFIFLLIYTFIYCNNNLTEVVHACISTGTRVLEYTFSYVCVPAQMPQHCLASSSIDVSANKIDINRGQNPTGTCDIMKK